MEKQFQDIIHFLKQYQVVHNIEYLRKYPNSYEEFIHPWIEELMDWDFQQLAQLESYPNEELVQDSDFKIYLSQIKALTTLEQLKTQETKLAPEFLRKLNLKKRHEVQTLRSFIDKHSKAQTFIDIGGGAGHLSCALVSDTNRQSICVDMDSQLQLSGLKKIQRWHPQIKNQIHFVESFFEADTNIEQEYNKDKSGVIGLHSCGPLSTYLIQFGVRKNLSEIISFGCCYHKITDEYNLSKIAKQEGLEFTNNALHLAGRSSAVVDEFDMQKRFKIKSYRYALHYYLYDRFGFDFYSVGNSNPSDFEKDFSAYAKKYHKGNELEKIDNNELNYFFNLDRTQELIKKNFLADLIRIQLGRVIEVYLLMDRALYLKESGWNVKLAELFDRKMSPRNILIYAQVTENTKQEN